MDASNVLGPFLQDVIGRDESLTPSSGRLRTIHARIVKEVEDAKQELHATVQKQWPTLKRQYNTTNDLSNRLKAVTSEVETLEGDLDGEESALRPRLRTKFVAHAQLVQRHQDADALRELLQSLRSLQQSNAVVQDMLAEGRFDEIVPALQACERLIGSEIQNWKKDCQPYRIMKEEFEHARNIAKERLDEALDRCIAFSDKQVTFALSTIAAEDPSSRRLRLHSLIKSLAALSGLDKHFQRIAGNLIRTLIEPVLVDRSYTITVRRVDEDTQLLVLQSSPPTSLEACLDSLRTVLQAIHTSIASEEASLETRQLLLSYLVPQVQQLLVTHLLVFLMPQNADRGALTTFQETCKLVADFEARELLSTNFTFEPKLQEWVEQAGQHWANALIQRSFATLRADVITSEYWNKTEKVDWLDDPNDVADKERWEKWLSNSSNADVTVEQQQGPEASTSRLPALIGHSSQAKIPDPASPEAEEDVAWEFEEEEQADDTIPASDSAPQSLPSAGVEDSPDLDADDAWGFDDDAHDAEAPELQSTERGINPATISKHGHKKNTLSHSSTRSRGSQKGTLSIKGQNNQHISLTGEIVEDDDDGGWSFDADADIDAEVEADKPLPIEELTPAEDSPVPVPNESGHSRQSSIEDAWGWSRNPDPDEDKPIGKPTKVIVSKKLGAKGRTGSPASPTPFSTDIESDTSRTSTPVMQQVSVNDAVDTMSSKQVEPGQSSAALAIDSVPQKPKQELTSLLISSSAKRVAETSMELLEAALAVSSSSQSSIDIASSSRHLFKAASDVFDFYRAIVPVAHSALISTVPSIGMQLSNDCLYVSHEGTRLTTTTIDSHLLSQEEKAAKMKPVEALRHYGHIVLEDQIELQRFPLMETLDEADGFRNTDDPRTFTQCQRCVRQLLHTITSISHAWKPVLLKRVYFESLGILVNAVLLRVLVEIENQEDISEESSHRLNDLCKMLHELESLFHDGEESTVALHVPVWFKFKFLSELLEASMADIMYLFNEGHLVDFSATELSKLVRALFADSQLRQRNLETIARGRPS